MPKKIFDSFVNAVVREIKNNYRIGDRFYSVREISQKYNVSVQTVERGIRQLENEGFLSAKRKSGITVTSLQSLTKPDDYKIAVVSAKADKRFNDAFFGGICETAREKGIQPEFRQIPNMDLLSIGFGEYLLSLNYDGIIALNFRNSALPFYHVIREGMDIVADIILDELPLLPAVQTDNYVHAQKAGLIFRKRGYRRILVVGYYPQKENRRYDGLFDIIKDDCDEIQYICLTDIGAINKIDAFLNKFNSRSAVFSVDYSANYIVGAKLVQHNIIAKNNNFLVYDCEEDFFVYHGAHPAKRVGPSFKILGSELCKVLLVKKESGSYPLPLQRRA